MEPFCYFFLMIRRPPRSPLFPSTTLFRSLRFDNRRPPRIQRLQQRPCPGVGGGLPWPWPRSPKRDRKSTRLNSSHANISYAVFCLKKKIPPSLALLTLLGSHVLPCPYLQL